MKIIKIACVLVCLGLLIISADDASAALINPSQIASVLGYPAGKLAITDITEQGKSRYGFGFIAAYKVESPDNTFAPMTFVVAKKGMILSPDLENQIAESEKSAQSDSSVKPMARKIQLGGDAYGYVGLGGFGPGGSEEMIIATIPNKGLDVQVKLMIPGKEPLKVVPETEAYHRLIMEGGEHLAQRLVECVKLTVTAASSLPASSPQPSATPQAPSPSPVNRESATPSTPAMPQASPTKAERLAPKEAAPSSLAWLYSLAVIILGGISFVFYCSRKR